MPDRLTFDAGVAIVTGAGGGLGRSHALALAERGVSVVVNDVGASSDGSGAAATPADAVVAEIRSLGGVAVADHHSVADAASAAAIVERAIVEFGRVDIVVNNAGILRDKTLHNITVDDWDAVIAVHLSGAFNVTRAAWPHMRANRFGRVINTSSAAAIVGNFGQANYSAAKAGLIGFTRVLATEGARYGIAANAIAPAARTRMTEQLLDAEQASRLDPARVSPLVVWLAHEHCNANGELFTVGAGHVARVFIGESRGITDAALTAETIRDRWNEVCSIEGFAEPRTPEQSFALLFGEER